ncbi:VOC family protein [Solibacillus silvestris]|uniref:VOC family protein n=1 Tax=Solibacillus silvestris TaxID=76853 RepID=UPI003F80F8CD
MKDLVKRIDTVFVEVRDLDHSIKWYSEILGLTMRWNQHGYAAFTVGETSLTLVQSADVKPARHSPFNFFTTNIEEVHKFLAANRVDTENIADYGNMRTFDFKDPDGHILGFCQFDE